MQGLFSLEKLCFEYPGVRVCKAMVPASDLGYPGCRIFGLVNGLAGWVRKSYGYDGIELFCQNVSRKKGFMTLSFGSELRHTGHASDLDFHLESFNFFLEEFPGSPWKGKSIGRKTPLWTRESPHIWWWLLTSGIYVLSSLSRIQRNGYKENSLWSIDIHGMSFLKFSLRVCSALHLDMQSRM